MQNRSILVQRQAFVHIAPCEGVLPFVIIMCSYIVLLAVFPETVVWLPDMFYP